MGRSTSTAALLALVGALTSCSDFTGPAAAPVPEWSHFHLDYHGEVDGRIEATGDPVVAPGRFESYAYAEGVGGDPAQPVFVGGFDVRGAEEGRTVVLFLSRGETGAYDLRSACLGRPGPARCATLEMMLDWNPSNDWMAETRSSQVYQLDEGEVVVTAVDGGRVRGTVKGVAYLANRSERTLDRSRRIEVSGTFSARFRR